MRIKNHFQKIKIDESCYLEVPLNKTFQAYFTPTWALLSGIHWIETMKDIVLKISEDTGQ